MLPGLSLHQARLVHLQAQGLRVNPRGRASRDGLLAAVRRMQLLQIDSIQVVARSPYLVLFSRLGSYPPQWLDQALAAGRLFETWAHEACFAPMDDYPVHAGYRRARMRHWAHARAHQLKDEHRQDMQGILRAIQERGAVRAGDFRGSGRRGGWWGWKDEKRWLEALFALGDLMVARRERFQRVYDLSERVLANAGFGCAPPALDLACARREMIVRSVRALGIAKTEWIADYYRLASRVREHELQSLEAAGVLEQIAVAGWDKPAWIHVDHAESARAASRGALRASRTCALSPFDPVIWDRRRALELFGFDYRIECYTPAHKRRFGYFVLPILHRGRLIGRMDAKVHRRESAFEVKALYLEAGTRADAVLAAGLAQMLVPLADWHGAPDIRLGQCGPARFKAALGRELRRSA